MNYIYCILSAEHKSEDGKYPFSDEDFDTLFQAADSKEAKEYLISNKQRLLNRKWAYNLIYLMKQACGHYEVFQSFVRNEHDALLWLERMSFEAQTRKCTSCICNIERR